MAPNGEQMKASRRRKSVSGSMVKPPQPPPPPKVLKGSLQRTLSDISFDLHRECTAYEMGSSEEGKGLATISEVENAKCECCGMREECTVEYIERVREKFMGKWICGLCSEAVKEEREKRGEKGIEGALKEHMKACVRFNKLGREYPALFQAEAMRDMLRRRGSSNSITPNSNSNSNPPAHKPAGIARSSSCIPAITRDLN